MSALNNDTQRYTNILCSCELGPHIEYEKDPEGEWVRFEDIEALEKRLQETSGLNHRFNEVKAFHEAFGHPTSGKPVLILPFRAVARFKWMNEELIEFLEADTISEQADAMIDLIYFALGTLVEMGVKPAELFDIVQEANMSKLWEDGKPRYKEDGKIMKPEGWIDPKEKLEEAIRKQMEPTSEELDAPYAGDDDFPSVLIY